MVDFGDSYQSESDTFVEVSHQSYGSRVCDSFKGLLIAPILMILSLVALIWNEGYAIQTHRSLNEALEATIDVQAKNLMQPSNTGKLIHTVGMASTSDVLEDSDFGVVPFNKALKLKRNSEMYQWVEHVRRETKKNNDGSTTTTKHYSYQKEWVDRAIDSSSFRRSGSHSNPSSMSFPGMSWVANPILLGADGGSDGGIVLPDRMVNDINWYEAISSRAISLDNIRDGSLREKTHLANFYSQTGFYISSSDGSSLSNPQIGDERVWYQVVPTQTVSVIGVVVGNTLGAYVAANQRTVMLIEPGMLTKEEMFLLAHQRASALAWLIRALGFILLWVGMQMLVEPISTLVDGVPFCGSTLGSALGGITGCITFLLSFCVSSVVILVAWLANRFWWMLFPLAGVGLIWFFFKLYRQEQQKGASAATNNYPPANNPAYSANNTAYSASNPAYSATAPLMEPHIPVAIGVPVPGEAQPLIPAKMV